MLCEAECCVKWSLRDLPLFDRRVEHAMRHSIAATEPPPGPFRGWFRVLAFSCFPGVFGLEL